MHIKWLEWNKESFQKAKKENKPILLDIMAVWCYWCKRLDKDTYENKDVISFVNNNFIPIRVDTDKRPDINSRYNWGGWPTTAVLNKKGEIINGVMYLPYYEMLNFLEQSLNSFKKDDHIEKEFLEEKFTNKNIKLIKENIYNIIKNYYDPYFGGFGNDNKFPNHNILNLLLSTFEIDSSKEMLIKTLKDMAEGEIFDKEEGGFYRYSTQQDWSSPHYEKLLDDNSRLLNVYLEVYNLTKIEKFKDISIKTIGFIINNFLNKKQGFFYASQDADEEYSKLKLNQRINSKKPYVDKTLFLDFNCYTIISFLTAHKILDKEEYKKIAIKTLEFLINNLVNKNGVLHYFDNKSNPPYLLKNSFLLINALMETKDKNYINLAEKLTKSTISNFLNKKENTFFDIKDSEDSFGYLKIKRTDIDDNSLAITVLLKIFNITKNKYYFDFAEKALLGIKNKINSNSISSVYFAQAIINYEKIKQLNGI